MVGHRENPRIKIKPQPKVEVVKVVKEDKPKKKKLGLFKKKKSE